MSEAEKPKVELVRTRLEKVDAETIKNSPQAGERLKVVTEWNYVINKKTADRAVISATCNTRFVPRGLLEVTTEFTLTYLCKEDISKDQLEKSMEQLLLPAGEQNALIVGQLTDKMRGTPMIVSPKVTLQDKWNLN